MKKILILLVIELVITFMNSFANVIIEKEFVKTNNAIATKQFEEGNAYQELAYAKELKDTLHTTNDILYIALTGTLSVYGGYSIYKLSKKFKELK